MADLDLCLKSQNGYNSNSCFSDSDFSDDDDLGIDIDFDEHEMPYITSPVFPNMPKLKENKNPWRVNAQGVQICDVGVGNDSDFAETKDMGVQVISRGNKDDNTNLKEADDEGNSNNCDLQSNEENRNSNSEENGNERRVMETDVLDKDHDLIREVHIENMDQFVNNTLPLQPLYRDAADDESSLEIRDEYSEHDFSETDIDYSEDSSDDDFWQPQVDRRWVGVSPAKYRLLRKWFYD